MKYSCLRYLLLLVGFMMSFNASADVEVNATNFPDAAFRNWVLQNVSGANDGMLTDAEISKVTRIACSGTYENHGNISSLQGIEFFTYLSQLYCFYNRLTTLDTSKNTGLFELYCNNNKLTTLDVSNNKILSSLDCYNNQLTSLDVSKNTALITLNCDNNKLTTLDIYNTDLRFLSCDSNQLTSLDVSKNTALISLSCSSNQLTTLELSKNTNLTYLYCSSNQLTTLDVSKNTALTSLSCDNNQLLCLNLGTNTKISNTDYTNISPQIASLTAKNVSGGIAIAVPNDFDFIKVSNLKLEGSSANGSVTIVDGQKYLVFAKLGTAQSSIDGKKLTYTYSTGNSFSQAASMDVTVTLSYTATTQTGIEVNSTNFPDEVFRNWVLENVSGASDGVLTEGEIAAVNEINYIGRSSNKDSVITTLQGIEFFSALSRLKCNSNKLTTLDVSKNTALTYLDCGWNQLTSLDVSKNPALTYLSCGGNQLTSLDVSKNTALTELNCDGNQLTSLDVSNTALKNLFCGSEQLASLNVSGCKALTRLSCWGNFTSLDLSTNTALDSLHCSSRPLTSLDLSKNTALTHLECHYTPLTSLDLSKNTALTHLECRYTPLTSLDLSKNTALTRLECFSNQLTSLDVSKNTALISLDCSSNKLTSLDVSKNTALTRLECDRNQLTTLDVSKNTALTTLYCSSNQLTSLDVSKNTALTELNCDGNQLTSLDVSKNTALTYLSCDGNQLTSLDVSKNTAITWLECCSNQLTSLDLSNNKSIRNLLTCIDPQTRSLTAVDVSAGIAIPVFSDFEISKVSNLKLNGTVASVSITSVNGQKYLVFASKGTAQSNIDGKELTYTYSTGNRFSQAASMDVTVTLSYSPTTYSLSIQSGAGGSVSYDGTTINNKTQSFTVNEGTSATITIIPNTGYQLSKLTVNGTNVTSSVKDNKYTISSVSGNTTVVATFEQVTYTLSVQATGNGTVTYNSTATKNKTNSFSVNHGSSATLSIAPDSGYRLASLTVNGTNVTSNVSNNQFTISNITTNTTVIATFEQIPATTYSLSIQSGAGGSVSFNGTTVTNTTRQFTVEEGTSATMTISPNSGYKLSSLTVNGTNGTSGVKDNQYTISSITGNTTVAVTFKSVPQTISVDGINYEVKSAKDYTLNVGHGDYSEHVIVPATISYDGDTWTVAGVVDGAFNTAAITAITWNPNTAIGNGAFGTQTNPNLLLYVKAEAYAPSNVQNVIANGRAKKIILTEAASGNDFYCPESFTAEEISYTHKYGMTTGINECRGWETIALPFDVKQFTHESKGTLIPFKVFSSTSTGKPFWLYRLTASGWQEAANIEANTPYIISLPNNKVYDNDYNLPGVMTFSSNNVTVPVTEAVRSTYGERTFVANFTSQSASWSIYALNVNNDYSTYSDYLPEGSTFIRELRTVHPFEAYMMNSSGNAKQFFPLFETLPTAIREIPIQEFNGMKGIRIYSLSGELIMYDEHITINEALKRLKRGVYFVNGKKMVIRKEAF